MVQVEEPVALHRLVQRGLALLQEHGLLRNLEKLGALRRVAGVDRLLLALHGLVPRQGGFLELRGEGRVGPDGDAEGGRGEALGWGEAMQEPRING